MTSPCGPSELRSFLNSKYGDFDEASLKSAINELMAQGKVSVISVNQVELWCLRGQRVG